MKVMSSGEEIYCTYGFAIPITRARDDLQGLVGFHVHVR